MGSNLRRVGGSVGFCAEARERAGEMWSGRGALGRTVRGRPDLWRPPPIFPKAKEGWAHVGGLAKTRGRLEKIVGARDFHRGLEL